MNLSAPFICEFYKDAQEKFLPYVDFLFGNEKEARTFSEVHGWETENVEEIALRLSRWPKASGTRKRIVVILSQDVDPIVVAEDGKVKKFPVILLPKDKIVDTNGAASLLTLTFDLASNPPISPLNSSPISPLVSPTLLPISVSTLPLVSPNDSHQAAILT
ncbi:hypothetical protein SO802_030487 [Lithocarpus litseifolius]|uniref:Adenosine kinase n=1 Tax=Lithocarpus litseifolius TaxID=425828 RepID=A0AAW2BHV5_9ROSI